MSLDQVPRIPPWCQVISFPRCPVDTCCPPSWISAFCGWGTRSPEVNAPKQLKAACTVCWCLHIPYLEVPWSSFPVQGVHSGQRPWRTTMALPDCGAVVKNPPANTYAGVSGLIPGSGRFPGGGNGNPLQYSCLGNSMDRGAWWLLQCRGCKRVRHDWVTEHAHSTDHCRVTHGHQSGSCVLRFKALIRNLIRLIILDSCLKLKWYFHFFLPFLCSGISTNWGLEIELFLGARKLFPAANTFLWLTCKILGYIFHSEEAARETEYRLVTINKLIYYQLYCRITFQAELGKQEKGCSSKTIFKRMSFFFFNPLVSIAMVNQGHFELCATKEFNDLQVLSRLTSSPTKLVNTRDWTKRESRICALPSSLFWLKTQISKLNPQPPYY